MTTRRGFRYDSGRSRLEVIVDGTVVAVFNNIAPSLSLTAPLEVGSGGTGASSLMLLLQSRPVRLGLY